MAIEDKILEAIQQNNYIHLTHLLASTQGINFYHKKISREGVEKLASVLAENHTVTHLCLANNQIGNQDVEKIASALIPNITLTELHLANNQIGNEGAKAIATALISNNMLIKLHLANNQIGDEGAKAIAAALKQNKTIIEIELSSNRRIGDDSANEIIAALKQNKTIIKFNPYCNQIGSKNMDEINNLVNRNYNLHNQCVKALKQNDFNQAQQLLQQGVNNGVDKSITICYFLYK